MTRVTSFFSNHWKTLLAWVFVIGMALGAAQIEVAGKVNAAEFQAHVADERLRDTLIQRDIADMKDILCEMRPASRKCR